jgi:hypothetical protein
MLSLITDYADNLNQSRNKNSPRTIVTVPEVPSLLNHANLKYQIGNSNNPIYDELSVTIQLELERLAAELSQAEDVVIFDRALPDRLPYLEPDQTFVTPAAIHNYNYVIYLDSPAFTDTSQLALDMGGEQRNETDTSQMADLARQTLAVWQGREIIRIPWCGTLEERQRLFTEALDRVLAVNSGR